VTWQPAADRPHIGVVLPTREALTLGAHLVSDFGAQAEALGFDSVWAGDSLLARPLLDPIVSLAAVAARTTTIRLGTGVLLVPMRQPVLTAHAIASLDQLSSGRTVLGLGRGFDLPETRREFMAAGVEFARRTLRLEQTIELWRALWSGSGGGVTATGADWRIDDVELRPRPAQEGGPPIWLAGFGAPMFERVGAIADGWLPYPPRPDLYRDGWAGVSDAATRAGRAGMVAPAVMATIAVDSTGQPSANVLEAYIQTFYGYPLEVVSLIQATFAGSADACASWLRDYWDAGARGFILRLAVPLDTIGGSLQHLDLVAREVLPHIRAWATDSTVVSG
jgi:alkanesulfonate monooxygenase SsuD/methylene tetrahydromethanopterin reductase-like flavin-dependent oxidoreductase (luciferase family)